MMQPYLQVQTKLLMFKKKIINKIKVIESSRIRYSFVQIFDYLKTVRPDVVISTHSMQILLFF